MKRFFFTCFLLLLLNSNMEAQILHTENFQTILDTSRVFKGNFLPSFRFRNVRENFIEIENIADISIRLNNHAFTIANKLEYAIFGKDDIMSGGFFYIEYRKINEGASFAFEPYAQMQWQEVRGLVRKYAAGMNIRLRAIHKPNVGLFLGVGAFYEHEKWNYAGVSDTTLIPENPVDVNASLPRGNVYLSFKRNFGTLFTLDLSGYYQPSFEHISKYRLASSSELTYNINQNVGFTVLYQNIYDPEPIVPIDKLYHDVTIGLTLSF